MRDDEEWPELPLAGWTETRANLHMFVQIVGKIRLALAPPLNHWWHSTLYVSARGLTTGPVPYDGNLFEIEFDFVEHALRVTTSLGAMRSLALRPCTVADFYLETMRLLAEMGIAVHIWPMPVEVPDPVRFDQDRRRVAYDEVHVHRFWRTLVIADSLMKEFRGRFIGKASPVHFFFGSFDLAATRFSGRRAPERPEADAVTREAYSQEVSSCGFWPGSGTLAGPAFYSYAAPEPPGFRDVKIPAPGYYSAEFSNFLLGYDSVRGLAARRQRVLEFFHATYEAAANLGNWDRKALER